MNKIEQQNSEINSNSSVSRRIGAGILAAGLMLGGVGRGSVNEARAEIVSPDIKSQTSGEMPSQKNELLDQLETAAVNQEMNGWPVVEGLNFREGKYYYQKDNVYGGKEGELAGMVKPEVYVEGEKVGGICFQSEVCKIFLEKALAETPKGELNLKSIPPIDISDYDGEIKINEDKVAGASGGVYGGVKIECLHNAKIVNTHLGSTEFGLGTFNVKGGDVAGMIMDRFAINYYNKSSPLYESLAYRYESIYFIGEGPPTNTTRLDGFGYSIFMKENKSIIFIDYGGIGFEKKVEDFVLVSNKVVFMIAKEKEVKAEVLEYKTLSVGYNGPEVAVLKQRMYELGYFKNNTVNESFTDATAEYVKQFEKANGLPVDGVADSEMLALFYSDKATPKP